MFKIFKQKKKFFNLLKIITFSFFVIFFLIILLSSFLNIYERKNKILNIFTKFTIVDHDIDDMYGLSEKDIFWAKKITGGGYILHFRHAERDKWIDVGMYDAIESDLYNNGKNNSLHAENSYFANAVCLNEKGKVQAKAMGEHIKNISLPIGHVISSVSCRGRQTATLAFGGYDSIHRILVHSGPYYENKKDRVNNLKEFYLKLPVHHGTNTVVLSHNSVISCSMFINKCEPKLDLEEGGFYVISKTDEGLFLHHKFRNFGLFTQVFYKR